MRVIGKNVRNKIIITDPIGGGSVEFSYRTPTTEERQRYNSALFSAKGRKVKVTVAEARQKYGLIILTGIREGDFLHADQADQTDHADHAAQAGDGNAPAVPISSDSSSPNYRTDWKTLVASYAADLVETMAAHVFEGARVQSSDDQEDEVETEDQAEEISEKN